jgi:hypothetical protein
MRTKLVVSVFVSAAFACATARAWDGDELWFSPAQGAVATPNNLMPGGAGILATGGAQDYNINCSNCHIMGAAGYGTISAEFTPPWGTTYVRRTQEVEAEAQRTQSRS